MTLPVQAVLQAMLKRPGEELYGFELARASGLASGTIYPIVTRLIDAGWLTACWEAPEAGQQEGRPPRRYFRLTAQGQARAVHALERTASRRAATSGMLARPVEGGTPA